MPKQKAAAVQRAAVRQEAARQLAVRRRSRQDPERLARLLIYGAIGVLMVVIVGVVAFGWYETKIAPLHKTVLSAGDTKVSFGTYERRVRYMLKQVANQANLGTIPDAVHQQLASEVVTIAGGKARGVNPSNADLDTYIRTQLGGSADAPNDAFIQTYRGAIKGSGLTEGEYRQMMLARLVGSQVQDQIKSEVPATADQVHLRAINFTTEADAQKGLDRLKAGDDFAAVAKDMATTQAAKDNGGDVPFAPKEALPVDYADQAFSLPINQVSDIISGNNTFWIIQVLERQSNRDLTDQQKTQVATRQYQDWLSRQNDEQNLKDNVTSADMNKALTWAFNHTDRTNANPTISVPIGPQGPANQSAPPPSDQSNPQPPDQSAPPPADLGAPQPQNQGAPQ